MGFEKTVANKTLKVINPDFSRFSPREHTHKEKKVEEEILFPLDEPSKTTLVIETERRLIAENEARKSKELLRLVFNLSTNFIYLPSDETDSGINDILGIVGQYAGVDRSYVFLFDESGRFLNNTNEWCAQGKERLIYKQQKLSIDDYPWFMERIKNLEIIHIPDVLELPPEASSEMEEWCGNDIRSLISIPMVYGATLVGFLGFHSSDKRERWPDEIILLLRLMGEFFTSAFTQRRTENKLQESASRYRTLFEYSNDSIFLIKNGQFVDCNSQTLRLYKCSREQIIGKGFHDFSPDFQPDGRKSSDKMVEKIKATLAGKPQFFEWRCRSGNRSLFDADVSLNKIDLGLDEILIQAIVRDVTTRKKWERALRESEERYRSLFNDSHDAIYVTRKDGTFVDANKAFFDLFGYSKEEVLRLNAKSAYLNEEDMKKFKEVIQTKDYVKDFEMILKKHDGSVMDCLVTVTLKRNENGEIIGYQGVIRDITATKRTEEMIRHMAYHDALTGLPNRVLFNDRLVMAMANGMRREKKVAVMMLDLDKFKQVNDVLGHKIGDMLLKSVADRLRETLRKNDTVARMGGDEFLIILPEICDISDAVNVAEKIVSAFQAPFMLENHELLITTSVGLAVYPENGSDAETITKNADIAMYQAKRLGKNKCVCYLSEMSDDMKENS